MRRRLVLQAVAITSMVALAFVVPLAVLVKDFAADRALAAAEREAENVARYMALRAPVPLDETDLEELTTGADMGFEVSILMPDGEVVGAAIPPEEDLTQALAGTASRFVADPGGVVYLPVIDASGTTSVVRVSVPSSELMMGVTRSWMILGALGIVLVVIAVLIADWIGRSIVNPVAELSDSAAKLGAGDMGARVTPDGPSEIRTMGAEFNRLATRIEQLLISEREAAADLSHRLRTPLTALRLDIESLQDGEGRERVLDDLSDLERTVDYVIDQARRGTRTGLPAARVDISAVVADRVAFWSALADDQDREMRAAAATEKAVVAMERDDASAMLDALIGNVFAHTPEGAPMAVTLLRRGEDVLLAVEDGGPGLPDRDVLKRGESGGASSGLGLDIARRSAESAGGDFRIGTSRTLGGAMVAIRLPLASG